MIESPSGLANYTLEIIHTILKLVEVEELKVKITVHPVEVLVTLIVIFIRTRHRLEHIRITYASYIFRRAGALA